MRTSDSAAWCECPRRSTPQRLRPTAGYYRTVNPAVDSLRTLSSGAGRLLSPLAVWTKRVVGVLVTVGPPAAFAWYVVTAGPAIHEFEHVLVGITSLVGLAAVVAVAVGWFLVVARVARAVPRLGGDDHESDRETTWLPPRRGT